MHLSHPDPLKIHYMVVLPQQPLETMSPFQGFAPGWWDVGWALPALAELPSDVLDGLGTINDLTSQRMGGLRHVLWRPVSIEAFERLGASDVGMFAVAFSGDRKVAGRIEAWKAGKGVPLLHVTSSDVATDLPSERLDAAAVIGHCRSVHASSGADLEPARREVSEAALRTWAARPLEDVPLEAWSHNLTTPNHMALKRCRRLLRPAGPLPPGTAEHYDAAILDSARAVMDVRQRAGFHPVHRLSLIHPEVYLVEPALFRHVYGRMRPGASREAEAAREVLRVMQAQKGFLSQGRRDTVLAMLEPGLANTLLTTRMLEVRTFTYGVGLAAAQTCSAVVRLSPAINHVFPALSAFGRSVRSRNFENRRKALRLFRRIQADMVDAVGPRRMQFLEDEVSGPVKIVSDAPVEWLPIGRLPLMIRHQCSRLNATPGNLLMGELSETESVSVTPDELRRVLVVSAFTADDPIRHDLTRAMERNRNLWDGQVDVTFVRVDTIADFMVELNRFSGSILVFDGHGALEQGDGIGKLMIGAEALDVWDMRGKVRTPPIVVLSACDTQGLDSPSHATVGNGFLALGAVTVVATLLPVGGSSGALFVARLMHRLAEFVPAVLRSGIRVLNWTEVVTGMQRMFLASEILDELVGSKGRAGPERVRLQVNANIWINSGEEDWFERLTEAIALHRRETREAIEDKMARVVATAEAIRYVQLGHPENIIIDDGSLHAEILPPLT